MASRASANSQGRTAKVGSASKPVANLVILTISFAAFVRLAIARQWIDWPPSQIGPILSALAGWIALTGPWILYRHEENAGGMGVGDRVWMTCGLALWFVLTLNLVQGNVPSLQTAVTGIAARELAILAGATLVGGLLSRPTATRWTWTNLTGWFLAIAWLTASTLPSGNGIWPLVALGGR